MLFPEESRYRNVTRSTAGCILFIIIVLIFWGLVNPISDIRTRQIKTEENDLHLYRAIAERIRSGEGYYESSKAELVKRGYPTGSIFNWRPPLLSWALGHLPDLRIAKAAAMLLSLITVWLWVSIFGKELPFSKVFVGSFLVLGGPLSSVATEAYLGHEFWAGTLITSSILFYTKGWRCIAFSAGILALLIRELALPFIIVMICLSSFERKYQETAIWALGIILFIIMMVIHSFHIKEIAPPDAIYSYSKWITFGGWNLILGTASSHPYFILFPPWFYAVLLPLVLLGLSGWKGPLGSRLGLTVGAYVFIFLFVGQDFNRYWGGLYTDLMFPGLLYLFPVTSDLCRPFSISKG